MKFLNFLFFFFQLKFISITIYKLSAAVDTTEGQASEVKHVNINRFNKSQCRLLHLGWGNPSTDWVKNSLNQHCGEWLGVSGVEKLDMNQECMLAAQ